MKKVSKKETPKVKTEVNATSVPFWREVARDLLPNEKNDWHIGEVALSLQLFAGLMKNSWKEISSFADRHDKVKMSLGLAIDRKEQPPVVRLRISGAVEGVDELAESVVPDPAQTELPGMEAEEASEPEDVTNN